MQPALSFIATLAILGVAFTLLHWLILALGLSDIVALLLLALPIAGYIAYTSEETGKSRFRFAARIYGVFATVTLAAVGLVFYID